MAHTSDLNAGKRFTAGSTASDLLAAAKRLDPQAWQELVDRYSWLIVRWCRQEGLSTDDAPDVLQAVLLRVVQHLGDFRKGWTDRRLSTLVAGGHSQPGCRIPPQSRQTTSRGRRFVGSTAILGYRRKKLGGRGRIRELDSLLERFWKLVDRLEEAFEPSTWQAFWLTTFENLNSTEAAEVLNITPAAVRLAKARVVRRIREEDANLANELKIAKERGSERCLTSENQRNAMPQFVLALGPQFLFGAPAPCAAPFI